MMSGTEAECEGLDPPLTVEEKQAEGMREAYECLVETLINATIKIAETEERVSAVRPNLLRYLRNSPRQNWSSNTSCNRPPGVSLRHCEKQVRYSTEQKRR